MAKDAIRFAVKRANGLSSNAWGAYRREQGDIYVACRDHMAGLKTSLHQSGKRHIAWSSESGNEMAEEDRFWNQWRELQCQPDFKLIPSFHLLFPSWGLGLTQAMRDANPKVWNKNKIWVDAEESPMATIVSFIVTDDDMSVDFGPDREPPSRLLDTLPARPGKRLWVIAQEQPEGTMSQLAAHGLRSLNQDAAKKLREFPSGHVLGMCVTGYTDDGVGYMMPYPVTMHWEEHASVPTTIVLKIALP